MQFKHVCIEGNIGIGKTTLVKKLASHFGTASFYEEFEENPWLPLFYENPEATALTLELSFLTDRIKQLKKIKEAQGDKPLFCDYSLDKCLLFARENLSPDDYLRYEKLHASVSKSIVPPALVIVIHSETEHLLSNIKQRGRLYEQNMKPAYLDKLKMAYKIYFKEERPYSILNIFTSRLDEKKYEQILHEIISFLKLNPSYKNTSIEL